MLSPNAEVIVRIRDGILTVHSTMADVANINLALALGQKAILEQGRADEVIQEATGNELLTLLPAKNGRGR
jgi:hypothetical protein